MPLRWGKSRFKGDWGNAGEESGSGSAELARRRLAFGQRWPPHEEPDEPTDVANGAPGKGEQPEVEEDHAVFEAQPGPKPAKQGG